MRKLNTVILIDDDEVALSLNEAVIRSVDCCKDLVVFPNAVQGLNYFRELCDLNNCPELILLDLKMPVIDGFEFLEEFDSFFSDYRSGIKIILLTSSSREQDQERARLLGVDDYLVKPLTFEKISNVIEKHFSKSSSTEIKNSVDRKANI